VEIPVLLVELPPNVATVFTGCHTGTDPLLTLGSFWRYWVLRYLLREFTVTVALALARPITSNVFASVFCTY